MYKEGQRVKWFESAGIAPGTGCIRGIASNDPATIGYIVQPDEPAKNWPYSHIVLLGCQLERDTESQEWLESIERNRENDRDLVEADWLNNQFPSSLAALI